MKPGEELGGLKMGPFPSCSTEAPVSMIAEESLGLGDMVFKAECAGYPAIGCCIDEPLSHGEKAAKPRARRRVSQRWSMNFIFAIGSG